MFRRRRHTFPGRRFVEVDENWDDVYLFADFEQPTAPVDQSDNEHGAFTILGNGVLYPRIFKTIYGDQCIDFINQGDSQIYLRNSPSGLDPIDNSDAWTIEYSFFPNDFSGANDTMGTWTESGNKKSWIITPSTTNYQFYYSTDGSTTTNAINVAHGMSINNWYSVALEHDDSDNLRLYIDGTMITKVTSFNPTFAGPHATDFFIGVRPGGTSASWPNHAMDEVRITLGVARYANDNGYDVRLPFWKP